LLGLLLTLAAPPPCRAVAADQLMRLLERGSCPGCRLQDADLVHADLRDADLRRTRLQRANLSGAALDRANLQGADLSFTSLQGASLRGADLRGARLEGTDLRQSDLSGARLDPAALARSHWQEAALAGNAPEAERLFGQALDQRPEAAISWLARGIARHDQGKNQQAATDFRWAATLYGQQGEAGTATQVNDAAELLEKASSARTPAGQGAGAQVMQALTGAFQSLLPLAVKMLPLML
ncbi:MAG: pentapeptide repeat-containing protein, partial [Cyanobacteriota bacterium]